MLLSVIVPAYNVEKYISRCLDSLLSQDIDDYEIIVVDDASIDNTKSIIQRDYLTNVIYIQKEKNSGLSDTRNVGMQAASGDYILFVDSDDYVEANYFSRIRQIIEDNSDADIVYTGFILERDGVVTPKKVYYSEKNRIWTTEEFLSNELKERSLPIPACVAIYRRRFLEENGLAFFPGILHEDELWTPTVLLRAKKIMTSGLCFYHYAIRPESITQKKDKTKNGLDLVFICDEMVKMAQCIENRDLRRLFENHIAMLYMKAMCIGRLYRKEYQNSYQRWLPIQYAYFLKDRIKALIFALSPKIYYQIDLKYGVKL